MVVVLELVWPAPWLLVEGTFGKDVCVRSGEGICGDRSCLHWHSAHYSGGPFWCKGGIEG